MKTKTINKSILKEGYYYEYVNGFYDKLPKELKVFPKANLVEKPNDRTMTEEEMMKGRKWLSKAEATSSAAQVVRDGDYKDGKVRIFFFEDEDNKGERCKLLVWLRDSKPNVDMFKFNPRLEWREGYISCSRNENLELKTSDPLKLSPLDTLRVKKLEKKLEKVTALAEKIISIISEE